MKKNYKYLIIGIIVLFIIATQFSLNSAQSAVPIDGFSCFDRDNGVNIHDPSFVNLQQDAGDNTFPVTSYQDTCISDNVIREMTCEGNRLVPVEVNCNTLGEGFTCQSSGSPEKGACVNENANYQCSSSGITSTLILNGEVIQEEDDTCFGSLNVYQYDCSADGNSIEFSSLRCPGDSSCRDGQCLNPDGSPVNGIQDFFENLNTTTIIIGLVGILAVFFLL